MSTLQLTEEETLTLQQSEFSLDAARLLYENYRNKITIEFPTVINDNYRIRSKGYIGFIPINDQYNLQIIPKIPIQNVFRMLEYAYRLKSFEFLPGLINVSSIEDVFENLASILAKRVLERNRKGLYRDYISKNESLPYLKGRVKIMPTLISLSRGSTHLQCDYEEHTADLLENQILVWTLYQIRRFKISRNDVRRLVQVAFRELISKVSIRDIKPEDCVGGLYHRLNLDYKPMHGICRFFLEHCGPGLEIGEYDFLPFILHMPTLFESFIAEWLDENLPRGFKIKKQFRANLDLDGRFIFKIDLVLLDSNGNVLAVLDTKYKKKGDPESADIEQIIAYAVRMDTSHGFLIYPSFDTFSFSLRARKIEVRSLIFDLSKGIDEAGKLFLGNLLDAVRSRVRETKL